MTQSMTEAHTEILQREHPVLRQTAAEVDFAEMGQAKLSHIIADMIAALESQEDGVAIAAPQIGHSLRIFVVSHRVFELTDTKHTQGNSGNQDKQGVDTTPKNMICINPRIIKSSKERKMMEEGCLSVRWLYGQVSRAVKVTIEAYDEHGKKFRVGASGLLAQVFQHETDHLNGVLFIDTATDVEEILPEKADTKAKAEAKK